MAVSPSDAWRLLLAIALGAAIVLSARAQAPRRATTGTELRRLVIAALALYGVGALALLTHHSVLAGLVYAAGIGICALAAWLSRGRDSDDPPGRHRPVDEEPPPAPDGLPEFDWAAFEREFRAHVASTRRAAGVR